jgi:hypothetical protein
LTGTCPNAYSIDTDYDILMLSIGLSSARVGHISEHIPRRSVTDCKSVKCVVWDITQNAIYCGESECQPSEFDLSVSVVGSGVKSDAGPFID